jgi:hypothetical protein
MSTEERAGLVLDRLDDEGREEFVRRAVDKPFAPPVVSSFELDSLDMRSAAALTPNAQSDRTA